MSNHLIYICEICGAVLEEHHCKAQCPNCGRMFDCSDLPLIQANGTVDDEQGELTLRPGASPLEMLPRSTVPAAPGNSADAPPPHAAPPPAPTALKLHQPINPSASDSAKT